MEFREYVSILNDGLDTIKGVGEKKTSLFAKRGIYNLWDLLYNFPQRYEDRTVYFTISDAPTGTSCCINATVRSAVVEKKIKKNISLYILRVEDATGVMNVKWFSSPFNKTKLKRGEHYTFFGVVDVSGNSKEMSLRDMEPFGEKTVTGVILPVYSLVSGLTQKDFRKAIAFVQSKLENMFETLPSDVLAEHNLMPLKEAVFQMHTPTDNDTLSKARRRIAFEELFVLGLALRRVRSLREIKSNIEITNIKCASDFAANLPFEMTQDQKKTINEICLDFKSGKPMNRLVQGDVGSGKTAVAACAAYIVAKNGYQTALMAPTEILANQHFEALTGFFANSGIRCCLLTSSTSKRKGLIESITRGEYDVVIGTHALIEDRVSFAKLGLCITDEQHRFGVNQRAALSKEDEHPHVLVMSATPIPRTLSLVIYGDLDVSVITTLPGGRQKVDTFCVGEQMRPRLNEFIRKQIEAGNQCFVVCPLIEESEKVNAQSGEETYKRLCDTFANVRIGFLHGKMSAEQKNDIMEKFRNNELSVLVSTTVIEVGIDVPNATLMIIESADRFGLSQLHQLRGRVGRGDKKSYCVLVTDSTNDFSKERMKIMCTHSDGFEIAEEDLRLRGCGEFFGTRQHGIPELKVANLFTDLPLAKEAMNCCDDLLKKDPELGLPQHRGLRLRIDRLFNEFGNFKIFN